jgi:predicted nucleic acid-binding protein
MEYENSINPYQLRKDTIRNFSYRCVQYVDASNEKEIVRIAKETVKPSIKEKDALHIACAIFAKCDYLLTTDDKMLKFKTDKIKICDPVQFVKEMEANADD